MTLDPSINLGQIIEAAAFIGAIAVAGIKLASRQDEFFRILERHEGTLEDHDKRLIDHGERIAALNPPERRRGH